MASTEVMSLGREVDMAPLHSWVAGEEVAVAVEIRPVALWGVPGFRMPSWGSYRRWPVDSVAGLADEGTACIGQSSPLQSGI
jgi:hypothetical protein